LPVVGTVEGLGIGVEGIWLAFSISALLAFLVAVGWFRLGRWTESVIEDGETVDGVDREGGVADAELDVDD
jgi:Na+-driven multidrug efflux pump